MIMTHATTLAASPTKLRTGAWGATVKSTAVRKGDTVTITTKAGKSWDATVAKVVWTGSGVTIVATADKAAPAKTRTPRRVGGQAAQVAGFASRCTDRPGCGCFDCR